MHGCTQDRTCPRCAHPWGGVHRVAEAFERLGSVRKAGLEIGTSGQMIHWILRRHGVATPKAPPRSRRTLCAYCGRAFELPPKSERTTCRKSCERNLLSRNATQRYNEAAERRRLQLLTLRSRGLTIAQIADVMNVYIGTARNWLKALGLNRRGARPALRG